MKKALLILSMAFLMVSWNISNGSISKKASVKAKTTKYQVISFISEETNIPEWVICEGSNAAGTHIKILALPNGTCQVIFNGVAGGPLSCDLAEVWCIYINP